MSNDIALIRLSGLVQMYDYVKNPDVLVMPVCLPKPRYDAEEPSVKAYTVYGWGKASNKENANDLIKKGVASRLPQRLDMPLYDKEMCQILFKGLVDDDFKKNYMSCFLK